MPDTINIRVLAPSEAELECLRTVLQEGRVMMNQSNAASMVLALRSGTLMGTDQPGTYMVSHLGRYILYYYSSPQRDIDAARERVVEAARDVMREVDGTPMLAGLRFAIAFMTASVKSLDALTATDAVETGDGGEG